VSRTFAGIRAPDGTADVRYTVNNQVRTLGKYLHVRNHSPDGFEWGYGGSGPAQCALAILMHVTRDRSLALKAYHDFKFQVIAQFGRYLGPETRSVAELTGTHTVEWELTEEQVEAWLLHWIATQPPRPEEEDLQ
jgi:hypothetical protein